MCGLFGWIGNLQADKRLVLATLLAKFNTTRGDQSWGFASREGGSGWKRERGLGEATRAIYKLAKQHTVMAHTRWATSGNVTIANAHPFELDGVMLAHNGVIYNDHDFYHEQFDVDSQLILNRIATGRDLSDLAGYGTITYTRPDKLDTVYLCNVGQGDLAVACILNRKKKVIALVWSSLEGHLIDTLNTAQLNWQMYKAAENTVYAATATGLYRTGAELAWSEGDYDWRDWRRNSLGHLEAPEPKSEAKPGVGADTGMVRTKCSVWDPKLGVWHDVHYWTKAGDNDDPDAPDYDLFAEYQGEKEVQV